jgi:hypothetical protein
VRVDVALVELPRGGLHLPGVDVLAGESAAQISPSA